MKRQCFIQIRRAECHQLICYVALGNASLGCRFIAHIQFEPPQAPVYENRQISYNYLLSISGRRKKNNDDQNLPLPGTSTCTVSVHQVGIHKQNVQQHEPC